MSQYNSRDTEEHTVLDKTRARKRAEYMDKKDNTISIAFTVIHGNELDFGKYFSFSEGPILIGREETSNINLKDDKISKRHCEVHIHRLREPEQIVLKDLESTNGTYVNGKPVREAVLKSGDKLSIGDTVLRLSYDDAIEEEYHSRLFTFAAIDTLTGLYNRRYTMNELESQCKIARRNNRFFSLLVVDIDNFKRINDTHGHLAGDDYLKKFAFTISRALREQDICGRVGGEEFLLILPETDLEGAYKLAERIREQVEKTEIIHQGTAIKTTISAGVSQFGLHAGEGRELFKKADIALQHAKRSGKNKVLRADSNAKKI